MRFVKWIVLAVAIFGIDFVTKALTNFYLPSYEHAMTIFPFGGIAVFRDFLGIDFCIHHVTNRGAAWGIGGGMQDLLLLLRMGVVVGLIVYLVRSKTAPMAPIILIAAGGLGNICDYFVYGHVVDMVHLFFWGYSFPVFNVADMSIFFGICWLILHSLITRKNVPTSQTQSPV